MGRSLTIRSSVTGRLVPMLVLCLLAPPLLHDHDGEKPVPISHLCCPCPSHGTAYHLHAAETVAAPDCPACAAGPAPAGLPTLPPAADLLSRGGDFSPRRWTICSSWAPRHSGARAPPSHLSA